MEQNKADKGLKAEARNWFVVMAMAFIIYIMGWFLIHAARWFIAWLS